VQAHVSGPEALNVGCTSTRGIGFAAQSLIRRGPPRPGLQASILQVKGRFRRPSWTLCVRS